MMAPRSRWSLALLAAASIPVVALGCSEGRRREANGGPSELRVVLNADIRGTNPGIDRDANTDDVLAHVVETLVAYREDLTLGPLLAEEFSVDPQGRVYTFKLREDVRFHNGAPLTSAEVKWSWERMLDPATRSLCREWYDGRQGLKVESVAAPDARTVVFTLDQPSAIFLHRQASFQCPAAILHPDSLVAGRWDKPVATGPFRLSEWRKGQYVTLERFEGYRPREGPVDGFTGAKPPLVDRIRWIVVPDAAAAKAALYSGQVELLYPLVPTDLPEARSASGVKVHQAESLAWSALLMQTRDPLLSDVRLRRAIAHAVDLDELSRAVGSRANPSVVPRAGVYHTPVHAQGHAYDPERARALLREAGYAGQPLKLQTNKRYPSMFDDAVVVHSMLKKVGLNAELDVQEWTTQLSNYLEGRFQLMSFGFSARTDPVFGYEVVLGSKKANAWVQWENAEAEALLREAGQELDPSRRRSLFESVHRLMLRDVPILNLHNGEVIHATRDGLEGYTIWSPGKPRLWGVRSGG